MKDGNKQASHGLMSIASVQHELDIGRSTVYNLIHAGKLASVKVGKYRRITRSSFNAYLEEIFEQVEARG